MNALYIAVAIPGYLFGIFAWATFLLLRNEPKNGWLFFAGSGVIILSSINVWLAFA